MRMPPLAGAVAGEVGEDHVLVDGGDVDDAAGLFGCGEAPADGLGEEERGLQVGVEDEIVVGFGGFEEGCVLFYAGVVDEDVATAELGVGRVDHVLYLVGLGDVGLEDDAFAAGGLDLVECVLRAFGMAHVIDDDVRAFGGEADGDGLADAGRGSGDEGYFACEAGHGIPRKDYLAAVFFAGFDSAIFLESICLAWRRVATRSSVRFFPARLT